MCHEGVFVCACGVVCFLFLVLGSWFVIFSDIITRSSVGNVGIFFFPKKSSDQNDKPQF